ncbi:hypothetical protein [Leuconostoc carnosum]|uniref:hypothetical protein n=1 Tax=Leuconostoc carnosum TaxID=1252 RepID=UPI00123967D3|nr:hypothetical protein [Leuconostoc carnosum]KAA8377135.1 hypothetical protein FE405_07465 [Leuconostoc carnosum]
MNYLIDMSNGKKIVKSEKKMFIYDCERALKEKGYELSLLEENSDDELQFDVVQPFIHVALGSVSMPSVAKIIVDFVEATYHERLRYEYVG